MPKLVIREGEGAREVQLQPGDTVGRTSQNAIQLKIPEASRTHCRFLLEKDSWFVEDLGSSNGTLVNGRRTTKFELQDGDVIQIGTVTLNFLEAAEEPPAPEGTWGADEISLEDQVFLILGAPGREGEVVRLPADRLSVGRNARHALVLKEASVSGDHAEIRLQQGRWYVRDLGSSNGTYVNDRRAEDMELASGDVIRFGNVACTFGVGDPQAFAPPPSAIPEDGQIGGPEITPGALPDDPRFELHGLPPKREGIWNVLALVVILALVGGVIYLVTRGTAPEGSQPGARVFPRGNLLPEAAWSFEVAEGEGQAVISGPMWVKEDLENPSSMGEVSEPVHSGFLAYRIERGPGGGPPSLATLDRAVTVTGGAAYALSAQVRGSAVPVLGVIWLEEGSDPSEAPPEVGRELIFGASARAEWASRGGVVVAPGGVTLARVAIGATGAGSVVFDDVILEAVDPPAGMVREAGPFKAVLGVHGTLRLSRYGRRIVDGLGVALRDGDQVRTQSELLVPDPAFAEEGSVAGTFRDGGGDLLASLEGGADSLSFRLRGPGLSHAPMVVVPLVPREGEEIQVTVLDGQQGERFGGPFADRPATALIVGSGGDRAKIRFRDAAGAGLRLATSLEMPGGRGRVLVALGELPELELDFQLSFIQEEREARELLAQGTQASRQGRSGEAIRLCEEVMARFPFEASLMEEAARLHARLMSAGRERVQELRRQVEDVTFFRDLGRQGGLQAEIGSEKEHYGGTSLEGEFEGLRQSLAEAVTAWEEPRLQLAAERIFSRGLDYMEGGRDPLAILFFETILGRYQQTDEAEQARALLARIRAKENSGGREQ